MNMRFIFTLSLSHFINFNIITICCVYLVSPKSPNLNAVRNEDIRRVWQNSLRHNYWQFSRQLLLKTVLSKPIRQEYVPQHYTGLQKTAQTRQNEVELVLFIMSQNLAKIFIA